MQQSDKPNNQQPKAYNQGWIEFFKLRFKVTPAVLIPRPETEILVENVIKADPRTIIEIGTGSGNIAISIAKNLPTVHITATEVSIEALKVARQNAKLHGVEKQIKFVESDLLEKVDQPADIIVTNLPYIPTERIPTLDESVKDFEPHVALDGGDDGFELYRQLFLQIIKKSLYPKYLLAEIDYTHAQIGVDEALKYFPGCSAEVKLDLFHRQRYLIIKF